MRTVVPGVGGDWNWIFALGYAAQHGLHFGSDAIFSYGPLGFLNTTYGPALYYGNVLALSWLFTAVVQLLLAATLLIALRRTLPLVPAVAIAAVVLTLAPERALVLGFAWCMLALAREQAPLPERVAAALPIALGALTGVLLLGKLNLGVELAVLAAIALAAIPSRRDALAFAATLLVTVLAGWLATGQTPSDVWPYLRYGVEIVAGYGEAMGAADWPHDSAYLVALAIAALALGLAWDATRGARPRHRWCLLAACAVYTAFNFKEGFVREDSLHLTLFFGDMLALFALLPIPHPRRLVAAVAIVAAVAALGTVAGADYLTRRANAYANVKAVADQARTVASPARRASLAAGLRQRIAEAYGLAPELLAAVGRRPVMFWPSLLGEIAWAHDLNLRPLPSLEPYSAYTPALDRLGGELLASARAPARIVRVATTSAPVIDNRHPTFEAPLATREILCRYRPVAQAGSWQVLARAADRCGAPRALGTTHAAWGAQVAVPAPRRPDALLLVRVEDAGPQGLERLKALLLRPDPRWIALDSQRYRLVTATAADGLLMHVPPDADYPGPFAMAPNPLVIAVGRDGGQPDGELRYTFVEVPIRPFAPAARGP